MTSYSLLLEEMSEIAQGVPDPIGIETSMQNLTSMTDVKPLIRSQTDVKRRAFDKGALARGGIINRPDTNI